MRIRVITLKDICKYLAKISLVFGIIAIFANFFYTKRNIRSCVSFDSTKYIGNIKQEILLLSVKNKDDKNSKNNKDYIFKTFNNEFSMFQAVATTNSGFNILKNGKESNQEEEIESNNQNENQEEEKEQINTEITEASTDVNVEVVSSNVPDKTTYELFGVKIRDECSYNLINEITDLNVEYNKQNVMIFHTHTCESYTQTENYTYQESGNFRTTDLNYSVARVGDELEKYLINYGYNVIHNKTYHDYPAYTGSYDRALVTVRDLLTQNINTDIVIDLHRDAIGDNTYAPKVKIGDEYCARLMFVIGTNGGGLSHDNWRENVKFAIKVQQKAEELYPRII